ncbi:MAG: DUF1549 and DUF1553 domain-containing protein [Planctomycetota bacterium]
MKHTWTRWVALGVLAGAVVPLCAQERLTVAPSRVTLDDADDSHRVVTLLVDRDGLTADVTGTVVVRFEPPGIAAFHEGRLRPLQDGATVAHIQHGDLATQVEVLVQGATTHDPVSFRNDVIPVLTRAGCNGGACHGAAAGKNGFGLTLFGFDPARDHRTLTRDLRGRRLDCADPDHSLMLSKPTGEARHKGGVVLQKGDPLWAELRAWIAEGAADDGEGVPAPVGLSVAPAELVLAGPGERARFVVTATYSDGSVRDVTDLALISSSAPTSAVVDGDRVVSGARGEAFVLARFGHLAEVAQVIVLPDAAPWHAPAMDTRNEIDELVQAKLRKLRLEPAPVCDDATFVRRVHLDIVGQLPSVDAVRVFLADTDEDKRARLVDELLAQPAFNDVWAMNLAEVLRIEADRLETKGVHVFTRWLRESLAAGTPLDEIVRAMLTANGSAYRVPEANYWATAQDPKVLAENAAQTFFGIRLQCAQCHNHPFERWRMDDYYGFAAFFTQVGRKRGDDPRETILIDQGRGEVANARTGRPSAARFLGGDAPEVPTGTDRRAVLAGWLTARDNPWFAQNLANRVWARFFGRGLVEPVDDVRVSNPPSHPELHRRLGEKLVAADFDLRALIREICASATYQAAAYPDGVADAATFASSVPRRLSAEQMLDAIGSVTEVPTKFRGIPLGASAVQIVDADAGNRFLELFGRPERESVCACERREEPTLNQVLHLINGETVEEKVRHKSGRIARLVAAGVAPDAMLDEIFMSAYARAPRAEERDHFLRIVAEAGEDPRPAWEDVLWAVLNSKEFLFQH